MPEPIPDGLCCKKCGSMNIRAERGKWGPHTERIKCFDCNAVTWGFGPGWRQRAVDLFRQIQSDPACARHHAAIRRLVDNL